MYCDIPEFGRCCFCLPLRRGVIVFGYLNILYSAFMVGMYSYCVHTDLSTHLVFKGATTYMLAPLCIVVMLIDLLANIVMVYGAHVKQVRIVRLFYYYAVMTTVAVVILDVVEIANVPYIYISFELGAFNFLGICIQVYLIILVRSLIRKLEVGGPHTFGNQLQAIVSGDNTANGVYNNCSVEPHTELV